MTPEEAKVKLAQIANERIGKGTYHCVRFDLSGRSAGEIIESGKCGLYVEKPPEDMKVWPDDCYGWFNAATFDEAFKQLDAVLNAPKPARFPMFQLTEHPEIYCSWIDSIIEQGESCQKS